MNTPSLLERTYQMLDDSPRTLREIAPLAGVGYHWLSKFKQRAYSDPRIGNVERLHAWLVADAQGVAQRPESSAA